MSGLLLLAGLGAGLSGCGTAPAAAIVNGQKISIQQLDQQMSDWASSPAYRRQYDTIAQSQAASSGNSSAPGLTVYGSGTGSEVYGRQWASMQLTFMIDAVIISQYLAAHHRAPSPDQVAAAWAAEEASSPQVWQQLPSRARTEAALQDAQAALVYGKATSSSSDKQFYDSHKADFWSQVCTASANVIVQGRDGSVNEAASRREAQAEAKAWSGQGHSLGAPTDAAQTCYSAERLLGQGTRLFNAVSGAKVGQAVAVSASPGYQVVKVLSRRTIPFGNWDATDIELVAQHGGNRYGPPVSEGGLGSVIRRAKVSVNIAYGAWAHNAQPPVSYVNPGVLH